MIFLQILGGILLAILVIIGGIYVYYRVTLGKYLHYEPKQEPLEIHLVEDIAPDWIEKQEVKKKINDLKNLGFHHGKTYSIYEISDVYLQVFFNPPITSVLYSHNIAGSWVDMVIEDDSGKEHTYSNAPMGSGIDQRPECNKDFSAKASTKDLYENISIITKNHETEFLKINENNFREYFESVYKKDISWKNRNGGISYSEFLKIEKETAFGSNKKRLKEAFIQLKEAELHQWNNAVLKDYLKTEKVSQEEAYDLEYNLIIVPYITDTTAFLRYLESKHFLNEHQLDDLKKSCSKETDIFKLFIKINNLFSPELRAQYVKEVEFPLNIKIFRLSNNMIS